MKSINNTYLGAKFNFLKNALHYKQKFFLIMILKNEFWTISLSDSTLLGSLLLEQNSRNETPSSKG